MDSQGTLATLTKTNKVIILSRSLLIFYQTNQNPTSPPRGKQGTIDLMPG